MDHQRSSLVVAIQSAEFAKEFHYFISVQLDGDQEKRRTDVSACVTNPVFTFNNFVIPLPSFKLDIYQRLHFGAFVVTDRDETANKQGQARLLGECDVDLGPLTPSLTDISGTGVRQMLKFTRMQNDKPVVVGRFIVLLKLVGEETIPIEDDKEKRFKDLNASDIFHPLPQNDPTMDFNWRLRVEVRSAADMPMNRAVNSTKGLPTCMAEVGWTLYDQQPPDDLALQFTNSVENNRHPIWNQQFFILNPPNSFDKEGFLYLCFRDRHLATPFDQVYVPVAPMKPFHPYHFEFYSSVQEYEARGVVYVSVTLEMRDRDNFVDSLVDVVVHRVLYDPLPLKVNRMILAMSTNGYRPKELKYIRVDLKGPTNIAKYIEENTNERERVFYSTILNIPPMQLENYYKATVVFTIPRSLMEQNLQFWVIGRDETKGAFHGMPNFSVGHSDVVDNVLQKIFFNQEPLSKKEALVPVTWEKESSLYPAFSTTKCLLELGAYALEDIKEKLEKEKEMAEKSILSEIAEKEKSVHYNGPSIDVQALLKGVSDDKKRWDILSKELAQKQELIHRLIRESDDKTESLKITGAEIVDLRRQIKMLQSENAILRKKLAQEEQIEVASIVTKEIARMGVEELRNKIIKLAQAYRDERVRNQEFEKSLKAAQRDIAQSKQLQAELDGIQKKHMEAAKKLLAMQQEISKTQLYKDTIKKQEKVISKLEKLMETTLKDTQKARNSLLELEQLKTENINLQKQLKQIAYGPEGENSDVEKYRREVSRLENLVSDLREELKSKRPTTSYGSTEMESQKMDLEVKLHRANARVEALQDEMAENAKNFAKEISQLKIIISEKQALLDTLSMDVKTHYDNY
mmetsp:Transcript_34749/g.40638  ORF Transcript_34749/g.40638 Transcript_34749/m.40638 type:complete len:858 (-) Transcript_34749:61-2634(-)